MTKPVKNYFEITYADLSERDLLSYVRRIHKIATMLGHEGQLVLDPDGPQANSGILLETVDDSTLSPYDERPYRLITFWGSIVLNIANQHHRSSAVVINNENMIKIRQIMDATSMHGRVHQIMVFERVHTLPIGTLVDSTNRRPRHQAMNEWYSLTTRHWLESINNT